uniref:Uncharacterized protein n=1 Tax=Strigamia maritima TaxID=126957 RepID=T1IRC3_STRMM
MGNCPCIKNTDDNHDDSHSGNSTLIFESARQLSTTIRNSAINARTQLEATVRESRRSCCKNIDDGCKQCDVLKHKLEEFSVPVL